MSQDLVLDFLQERARLEDPKFWTPREIRDAIRDKLINGESHSSASIGRQLRQLYDTYNWTDDKGIKHKYLEIDYPTRSFWRPGYRYKKKVTGIDT